MQRTERMEIRTTPDLRERVEAECRRRGQTFTTFAERALEAALGRTGGGVQTEPQKPAAPVPPRTPVACGSVMVGEGTDTYDPVCELPEGHRGSCKSTAAISQNRIAPSFRRDVGPKPASASRPRPKTTPAKGRAR